MVQHAGHDMKHHCRAATDQVHLSLKLLPTGFCCQTAMMSFFIAVSPTTAVRLENWKQAGATT
jgi:hypothetical protein